MSSNQPKTRRQPARRRARRWSGKLSDMTAHQLELEALREKLRDQRWERRKSMIETAGKWGAAVVVSVAVLTRRLPIADAVAAYSDGSEREQGPCVRSLLRRQSSHHRGGVRWAVRRPIPVRTRRAKRPRSSPLPIAQADLISEPVMTRTDARLSKSCRTAPAKGVDVESPREHRPHCQNG